MLSTAPGASPKHLAMVAALVISSLALFTLLLHLVIGIATTPVPAVVTGSFGTNRSADYRHAQEPPVAPQRTR